jgi:hypothetical protein
VRLVKYKRLAILAGAAFVAFFLVQDPNASATLVQNAIGSVGNVADKLAVFVKQLVS